VFRAYDIARKTIKRIAPYSPGKNSEEVKREFGLAEITKLASNENPLGPSPMAVEAICAAAADVGVYPDPLCVELTSALAKHLGVLPDNILIGRGSDEILHMLGLAFVSPGDDVVFSQFPFAMYRIIPCLQGANLIEVPARGFDHDLDAIASAITDRTRLVFIGNPCNPTGTIVKAEQVERFMSRVPETTVIAFDEAYFEYVDDPDFPDTLAYVRRGRRAAVLRTFSKVYALAGLRIGYGICGRGVADALRQVLEPFNVSSIAQVAAVASLQDPDQLARSRKMVFDGKAYLYERFAQMGLEYVPTQTNFILVDTGVDSRAVFGGLMRRGVTIRTGDIFGLPTWIRVTIGTPEQNALFIDALRAVLEDHAGGR